MKGSGATPTSAGLDGLAYWILQVDGSEVVTVEGTTWNRPARPSMDDMNEDQRAFTVACCDLIDRVSDDHEPRRFSNDGVAVCRCGWRGTRSTFLRHRAKRLEEAVDGLLDAVESALGVKSHLTYDANGVPSLQYERLG